MSLVDCPRISGLTRLVDKSVFESQVSFVGLVIESRWSTVFKKKLDRFLHKYLRIQRILDASLLGDGDMNNNKNNDFSISNCITKDFKFDIKKSRIVLLDIDRFPTPDHVYSDPELLSMLNEYSIEILSVIDSITFTLTFDNYWSADELINAILPDHLNFGTSFETVGHLAHLNLRDELLEYKYVIGEIILLKHMPQITVVVNKIGKIESVYRTFEMEVIASSTSYDNNSLFNVEVKENDCIYRFDFSKTYWNSRLQHEHERLVKIFKSGEFICDVCCGVGPFVLPSLKKGCNVICNDLNPDSIKYLKQNIDLNNRKVMGPGKCIEIYNIDGRELMTMLFSSFSQRMDHVIINLPASSLEFLDIFRSNSQLPYLPKLLHIYTFSKESDYIVQRAQELLGNNYLIHTYEIHHVRKVAPNKEMFRLSLSLLSP